jgi:hypothetical protein
MQVCGCLFHFKQAVRRNLSQKGLITLYNSCHKFQYLVHMLYSLVFVPVPRVVDIYDTVIRGFLDENTNEEGIVDNLDAVEDFLTYFENTWLGRQVNWEPFFLFYKNCVSSSSCIVWFKVLSHEI